MGGGGGGRGMGGGGGGRGRKEQYNQYGVMIGCGSFWEIERERVLERDSWLREILLAYTAVH